MLERRNVAPIPIREATQYALYATLMNRGFGESHTEFKRSAEFVLSVMLEHNLTLVKNRKAVWLYHLLQGDIYPGGSSYLHIDIGESFPDSTFAKNCRIFCEEKVRRAIKSNLLCSHQNRDPENNEWGGSAYLKFELIATDGSATIVEVDFAPSGLKEWEDLVLGLAAYYHAGFIKLDDQQVQNILQEADMSVMNQPDFKPDYGNITQYAEMVFERIADIRA